MAYDRASFLAGVAAGRALRTLPPRMMYQPEETYGEFEVTVERPDNGLYYFTYAIQGEDITVEYWIEGKTRLIETEHYTEYDLTAKIKFMSLGFYNIVFKGNIKNITFDHAGNYYANFIGPKEVITPFPATMSAIRDFSGKFSRCYELVSIPRGLLKNCPNATNFHGMFSQCSKLSEIPGDLFSYTETGGLFIGTFVQCTSITSIPSELFHCKSYYPGVLFAQDTFAGCSSITDIPDNLFEYHDEIYMKRMFQGCKSITEIPDLLIGKNWAQLYSAFNGCNNVEGNVPEWWEIERFNHPDHDYSGFTEETASMVERLGVGYLGGNCCFSGCTKASNYDSIPSWWKEGVPHL